MEYPLINHSTPCLKWRYAAKQAKFVTAFFECVSIFPIPRLHRNRQISNIFLLIIHFGHSQLIATTRPLPGARNGFMVIAKRPLKSHARILAL